MTRRMILPSTIQAAPEPEDEFCDCPACALGRRDVVRFAATFVCAAVGAAALSSPAFAALDEVDPPAEFDPDELLAEAPRDLEETEQLAAVPRTRVRRLRLHNVNTNEVFDDVYWRNGRYVGRSLQRLNVLLRDHRARRATRMDPRLFDLLWTVQRRLGANGEYRVVSAYRSPETNAARRRASRRVARNSMHMYGKAMDVALPGRSAEGIARLAATMRLGGVGLYRRDGFVHLDTGPPRRWS